MGNTDTGSGDVDSALDLFMGDQPEQPVTPMKVTAKPAAKSDSTERRKQEEQLSKRQASTEGDRKGTTRPKARTGRPPGIKPSEARLKDKTSLALDRELMDFYRKQSWTEQCQLGELVERALSDFAKRTWDWGHQR